MEQQVINWEQLQKDLEKVNHDIITCFCNYQKYLSWKKPDNEDIIQLQNRGRVVDNNKQTADHDSEYSCKINYWSPEYPMAFKYYPYYGCDVYECTNCKRLFFVYMEFGGHAPEKRCRLIRKELMVFDTP